MKNMTRILSFVLVITVLGAALLTGCSVPKITYNKLPDTAATYGDKTISTGEYLAYLYLEFENLYYNQGLYQYEYYGMDPWAQTFPYGEGGEKLSLSDYIIRATQDNIKRQIALAQMMVDNDLQWIEEDLKEIQKNLDAMEKDAYLVLGFDNANYGIALKNANLNERSAFYGLYGKGGKREVKEEDLKKYFNENYLSYKSFSIALTDDKGKELDKKGEAYKKIMDRMDKYMEIYKEKGFDEAKKQFDADEKAIKEEASKPTTTTGTGSTTTAATTTTTTTTATTTTTTTTAAETTTTTGDGHDHDHEEEEEDKDPNRVDVDSTGMDEALKDAIVGKTDKDGKVEQEGVKVGEAKLVEYKAGGSTPTIALIERLDINVDRNGVEGGLYEDSIESIIYELKYEEFSKEVDEYLADLTVDFNEKVIKKAKPEEFLEIINNL